MKTTTSLWIAFLLITLPCFGKNVSPMNSSPFISPQNINQTIQELKKTHGDAASFRIERGVQQVANLWQESDGSAKEFEEFCQKNFEADLSKLAQLYKKLETGFEVLKGHYNVMDLKLKEPLALSGPEIEPIDMLFGGYDVSAHFNDDMYLSKIAFITALNFPFYTLEEKTNLGTTWTRQQWAFARMGDMFTTRVPASLQLKIAKNLTEADTYISEYNIFMGNLLNKQGKQLFPKDMKLITHWGLRDELKSNYADTKQGLEKQRMVYAVMKRIIDQTIPMEVINNGKYNWNPVTNTLFDTNGKTVTGTPEQQRRYEVFLNNFHMMRELDAYSPDYPNAILRAFDGTMEIPEKDVVDLFKRFLSSPEVKKVAAFIQKRLNRKLEPFDIWYNGFKARGTMPEDELTAITSQKYPNAKALEADLPNILVKLGWKPDAAHRIASLVQVDASRGAGHAAGSAMRNDKAHLRSRIGENGMDYKGYNIAVHEFGHNVEQTITMNDVDYYMLNGVPNTAFTEAVAFMFQKRDLELLGLQNPNPEDEHYIALDVFWSCYEIMGVSLVDIQIWNWMYAHPDATPAQLKEALIQIAKDVWNTYYAGILGGKDEILLGIYSHMIDYPLYLPNYPMGHLIDFQLGQEIRGKNMADEVQRIYTQGRIIPQLWMKNAVGSPVAIEPLLKATQEALRKIK